MKKITALVLTASMLLVLFGCAGAPAETTAPTQATPPTTAPTETTVPKTTVPPETASLQAPDGYVCLNQMIEDTDITITCSGQNIILSEDGLTVELSVDSLLVYRDGSIVGVMKAVPRIKDGAVYVHEAFYTDFLCREKIHCFPTEDVVLPSLFHGMLFSADEILNALDQPDAPAFNRKLLEEVLLPVSMNIETPHVDMMRVFQDNPLSEYPEVLRAELEGLGYSNVESFTYSEYVVLSGAQTLAQAGISSNDKTTVEEYNRRQRAQGLERYAEGLTEEEKAFVAEKQIELTDLSYLKEVFPTDYMERSDESLKTALEGYYEEGILFLESLAAGSSEE